MRLNPIRIIGEPCSGSKPALTPFCRRHAWFLGAGLLLAVSGQQCLPTSSDGTGDTTTPTVEVQPMVRVATTRGNIVIELFNHQSPLTVANFLQYVSEGFYNGTIVHDVRFNVSGSSDSISAGKYTEDLKVKTTHDPVANESNNGLSNLRGRVALIEPDGTGTSTGTSAFVIHVEDNTGSDYSLKTGTRGLTVFGRVVDGMDIVDAIAALKTKSTTDQEGDTLARLPVDTVRITSIVLETVSTVTENHAPAANAGADQTVEQNAVVVLDGSLSGDADDDAITFRWQQTSGPPVALNNTAVIRPSFTANAVATLTFDLTVTDSSGETDTDSVTITVNSGENHAPVANAGPDQTVDSGSTVTLNGTGSTDPDAGTLTYSWIQTGGTSVILSDAASAQPTFTAPSSSTTIKFELTISDPRGGLATDTVTIRVNVPPTANAGADRLVAEKVVVKLKGSGSDPDAGDTLTYSWQQTAGPTVTLSDPAVAEPSFTVPSGSETLSFQLTVTDTVGKFASDSVTLTPVTSPKVRLATTMGDIVLDMLEDDAPISSTNFLQYVEDGFYDGTIFHRVAYTSTTPPEPFVVQGGGFKPGKIRKTEADGLRGPIQNEFSATRSNLRSTVAMAKLSGDPDSATSQFFINMRDNSANLDSQNGGFSVFADVVEGMDVADNIAAVARDSDDAPVTDVIVNTATLEQ